MYIGCVVRHFPRQPTIKQTVCAIYWSLNAPLSSIYIRADVIAVQKSGEVRLSERDGRIPPDTGALFNRMKFWELRRLEQEKNRWQAHAAHVGDLKMSGAR